MVLLGLQASWVWSGVCLPPAHPTGARATSQLIHLAVGGLRSMLAVGGRHLHGPHKAVHNLTAGLSQSKGPVKERNREVPRTETSLLGT